MSLTIIDPVLGAVAVPGLPYANAGAPVSGTSGSFAGLASKGALLVDTTNATLYQNTGTQASPTWTQLTAVGGSGAYSGTFDGVTGGVTPAAGSFTTLALTGLETRTVANALTAAVTQTRGQGALTKQINRITVCAHSGDAVTLPAAAIGLVVTIFNDGANPASVFPAGASDTIDGGSGGAAVTLTNAKRASFYCVAATTWISAQLGVVSA